MTRDCKIYLAVGFPLSASSYSLDLLPSHLIATLSKNIGRVARIISKPKVGSKIEQLHLIGPRSESIGSSRSQEALQKSPADRRVDTAQDYRAIPSRNKTPVTEHVSPGSENQRNENQNRSEQAAEVHNADGQKVAPTAQNDNHAQQHNEEQTDQQVNVDATAEQSQASEVPLALLKHLEKFEIKTEQNEVAQVGEQQESAPN
ncbi:MAG: hypothetical protein JKY95_04910, partial [Planctomycetaceae bacterium]|nr:hypothetical protein [Planctomycetaceae bacterium]